MLTDVHLRQYKLRTIKCTFNERWLCKGSRLFPADAGTPVPMAGTIEASNASSARHKRICKLTAAHYSIRTCPVVLHHESIIPMSLSERKLQPFLSLTLLRNKNGALQLLAADMVPRLSAQIFSIRAAWKCPELGLQILGSMPTIFTLMTSCALLIRCTWRIYRPLL